MCNKWRARKGFLYKSTRTWKIKLLCTHEVTCSCYGNGITQTKQNCKFEMHKDKLITTTRASKVQVEDHVDIDNDTNDGTSVK